jgi:hypothetical protein
VGRAKRQKYIRVVHLFSGRPSGLRIQNNKDMVPLSIFVYSQQFSYYRWMKKSGIATNISTQ